LTNSKQDWYGDGDGDGSEAPRGQFHEGGIGR